MCSHIKVVDEEELIEIPVDYDNPNSILLSTLRSQFCGATGLTYRHTATGKVRGIRCCDGRLFAPNDGWRINTIYYCVFPKENNSKNRPPERQIDDQCDDKYLTPESAIDGRNDAKNRIKQEVV